MAICTCVLSSRLATRTLKQDGSFLFPVHHLAQALENTLLSTWKKTDHIGAVSPVDHGYHSITGED